MLKHIKTLTAAIFISLMGSLPLGTLNVASFQLTMTSGIDVALAFAFGAIIVEVIFVRLSLIPVFHLSDKWMIYCLPIMATVLIFMGYYSIMKDINLPEVAIYLNVRNAIVTGVTLSAINPLQFPYWFGWSNVFRRKKLLDDSKNSRRSYLIGIAIGSGLGFLSFIIVATTFQENFLSYASLLDAIVGALYFLFAAILLIRLFKIIYKIKLARI